MKLARPLDRTKTRTEVARKISTPEVSINRWTSIEKIKVSIVHLPNARKKLPKIHLGLPSELIEDTESNSSPLSP
jgi:hypothetical protein